MGTTSINAMFLQAGRSFRRFFGLVLILSQAGWPANGYLQASRYTVGTADESISRLLPLDLNGDGRDDLVVLIEPAPLPGSPSAANPGHLVVLLAVGDGTLGQGTIYTVGELPSYIFPADINGDGKLDLLIGNSACFAPGCGPNSISVFLGDGQGGFSGPTNYPLPDHLGAFPSSASREAMQLVDVNKDGKLDLVTSNTGHLNVLMGNGDGTFQPATRVQVGDIDDFVFGDFDGDGKLDLVAECCGGIETLLGNGDGSFQIPFTQGGLINGGALSAGDLNNDGKLDIRIDSCSESTCLSSVMLGNEDGTFQSAMAVPPAAPSPPPNWDFDRDGKLDTASNIFGNIGVQLGFQDAVPDQSVTYVAGVASGGIFPNVSPIFAMDLYGDGRLSLLGWSQGPCNEFGQCTAGNQAIVLVGNGDGSFQAEQQYKTGNAPGAIAVGDFNGDGLQDQVIVNRADNNLTLLLSRGNGTFRSYTLPAGANPQGVITGDFDHDGKMDIAVANANDNTVSVRLGNGDGTFKPPVTYLVGGDPRSVETQDFRGVNKLDLVTANRLSNTLSVLQGNGDGTFQPAMTFSNPTLNSPRSVATADLNGDHKADLVVANAGNNDISVLLNDGTGHFPDAAVFAVQNTPVAVTLGDLNGDGKNDAIVANSASDSVSVLLGNGDGSFQPAVNIPVAANTKPSAVSLLDANGDGKLDMVTANSGTNNLSLFLGNGDGTFETATNLPAGSRPEAVHAGNFSGAGLLDLSASNNLSLTTNVFLNGGATAASASSSANLTAYGQPVTLTAQFTQAIKGFSIPTGTATFKNGSTTLATISLDAQGKAAYTTSALAPGATTITARYSGDSRFFANSATFDQTVDKAPSTTDLGLGSNPSVYGNYASFTAHVSSSFGIPTGTISFNDGAATLNLATVDSNGNANYNPLDLTAGIHTITAIYSGDQDRSASVSAAQTQTVNQATTSTQVSSSFNPAGLGATVTFNVQVSSTSGIPTGNVALIDGNNALTSGTLDGFGQASFDVDTLPLGPHTITAAYAGDINFRGSTSTAIDQSVLHRTFTALTGPVSTPKFSQPMSFTAMVTSPDGGTPTGNVIFMDGANLLGPLPLDGAGQAVFTVPAGAPLVPGTHTITAHYGGDADFVSSDSSALLQAVDGLNLALTLTHTPVPIVHIGQTAKITLVLKNNDNVAANVVTAALGFTGGEGYAVSASFNIAPGNTSGTCGVNPVSCALGMLNPGDVATITVMAVPTRGPSVLATASTNATTDTASDTIKVRYRPFRY